MEKDIRHHGSVVSAVVNLCSLLQFDRDAGYDQSVKKELVNVKSRLSGRWKRLCDQVCVVRADVLLTGVVTQSDGRQQ